MPEIKDGLPLFQGNNAGNNVDWDTISDALGDAIAIIGGQQTAPGFQQPPQPQTPRFGILDAVIVLGIIFIIFKTFQKS